MNKRTRATVSIFGVLASLAGIEHGIGEVLQGNARPEGVVIESWPDSEAFRILNGEPAMTVVPNLLITGVLTIAASLVFLVWTTMFVDRPHGGLVLFLISLIMFFVGAGFGPPLLGVILSIAATKINAPITWWRAHTTRFVGQLLGASWPWVLGAGIIVWLALFPGVVLSVSVLGVDAESDAAAAAVAAIMVAAFALLGLSIFAALARDAREQTEPMEAAYA